MMRLGAQVRPNLQPGERWRASYACDPMRSRGRLHQEPPSPTRSDFQRDRDRIIHCAAFRRLTHKTQVFIYHEGDHFRSRLTHTLEVSQIARALARALGLDEDLAEAIALAHDLGHPPFGHTGEEALDTCLAGVGGFDHNAQALRVVTRLEHRYAAFPGLNLSWETREGLVKHNGPLLGPGGEPAERHRESGIPGAILEEDERQPLALHLFAAGEAQAAAIADDIAYNAHDLDDGLRAGILEIGDLRQVAFLAELLDEVAALHPDLDQPRLVHELSRRVITRFVEDVIAESERRLVELAPASADAIREAGRPVIAFSAAMAQVDCAIKAHLFPRLYRHERLMSVRRDAEQVVQDLFGRFTRDPAAIPDDWRRGLDPADPGRTARRAGDYIAGMTDRFALLEHRRLFERTPSLRIS
jgi:dGTPase